jgi:hypothetical protein
MAAISHSLNRSGSSIYLGISYNQPSPNNMLSSSTGEPVVTEEGDESNDQQSAVGAGQQSSQESRAASELNVTAQTALIVSPLMTSSDPTDGLSQEEVQNMDKQIEQDLGPDSEASAQEV